MLPGRRFAQSQNMRYCKQKNNQKQKRIRKRVRKTESGLYGGDSSKPCIFVNLDVFKHLTVCFWQPRYRLQPRYWNIHRNMFDASVLAIRPYHVKHRILVCIYIYIYIGPVWVPVRSPKAYAGLRKNIVPFGGDKTCLHESWMPGNLWLCWERSAFGRSKHKCLLFLGQ